MLDAVALQIMWNRLISVVEEQAQALIRTAFSTSVREAGDLSAGVYDHNAIDAALAAYTAEVRRQEQEEKSHAH